MLSSSISSTSSTSAPRGIADVLYRSLESALVALSRKRHENEITLHRLESEDASVLHLCVEYEQLGRMPVRFTIRQGGTANFQVRCAVEGGPTRQFSYQGASRDGTTLSHAPCLGRDLASFLLDELERRVGRRLLRGASNPTVRGDSGPAGRSSPLPPGSSS